MPAILIGHNDHAGVALDSPDRSHHGRGAGAPGTGNTVSPMVLADGFSRLAAPGRSPVGKRCSSAINHEPPAERQARPTQTRAPEASQRSGTPPAPRSAYEPGWNGAIHDALPGTGRRQRMRMGKQAKRCMGNQQRGQSLHRVRGGSLGGCR